MLNEEKLLGELVQYWRISNKNLYFNLHSKCLLQQIATELLNMWFTDSVTQPAKQEIIV
jgi:hypothetical protein